MAPALCFSCVGEWFSWCLLWVKEPRGWWSAGSAGNVSIPTPLFTAELANIYSFLVTQGGLWHSSVPGTLQSLVLGAPGCQPGPPRILLVISHNLPGL